MTSHRGRLALNLLTEAARPHGQAALCRLLMREVLACVILDGLLARVEAAELPRALHAIACLLIVQFAALVKYHRLCVGIVLFYVKVYLFDTFS